MQKLAIFCLLVSFLTFPSSAANTEYVSRDTFWNWAAGSNGVVKQIINFVGGLGTCSKSEDTYHHASSYFKEGNVDGEVRYRCICDLCGDSFTAYESDLQQSYEAQVEEMPVDNINSQGLSNFYITGWTYDCYDGAVFGSTISDFPYFTAHSPKGVIEFTVKSGVFQVPVSGNYRIVFPATSLDGGEYYRSVPYWYRYYSSTKDSLGFNVEKGGSCVVALLSSESYYISCDSFLRSSLLVTFKCDRPYIEGVKVASSGDTTYNITSRPTSITGDYGIIGDNGQIIKVEGDKIVNETNNTYYNPSTGETTAITDWSYNYEDRSYTVTTEAGDTVTITYGDENVVIKEGDTTYNIYYLVDGSGSEDPGPGPEVCDHTWTETGRTEPTCTTAGKVTSTCSKCNQTKTETIPATGHSWVVDRTVQTEYDEEGNLLQQGYTIYSCSVCGEQYKDMEGTGPPGPEEEKSIWEQIGDLIGTIAGGFLGLIEAVFGKLLDALISLAEMLMDKLKTVVETVLSIFDEVPALFGGFLDFLGAIFPFLPPEITTILTFGVIAITFIGILKAVRR